MGKEERGSWDVCWLLVVVAVNVVVVVVLKVSDGICFDTAIIRREIVWKQ
jgi:t-SNARE complex subunit (syntaxin)